jgi:hypothetical protein
MARVWEITTVSLIARYPTVILHGLRSCNVKTQICVTSPQCVNMDMWQP